MKNIIPLILCIISINTFSQENYYKDYYTLCYEAEYNTIKNEKNKAWNEYNKAFKSFFPQILNLNKAIKLGEELVLEEKSINAQLNLLISFKDIFFGENMLSKEINFIEKNKLINTFTYLKASDFESASPNKINNIIKLSNFLYLDQSIRKLENNECKDSLIIIADKKVYSDFIQYLKENKYPTQREYGMYSVYPHFLFLHNTIYHGITDELKIILFEQMKLGNYHPSQYARLVDRYKTWILKEPQVYGEWIENFEIGNIIDIYNVDERRNEIGLENLYEFCLKNGLKLPKGYVIPEKYLK
jgi:hypothetical protein